MQAHSDQRLLCLSLRGLSEQDAAIWIDMVSSGWRNHPKAVPLQLVGLTLIVAPYAVARALTNRFARLQSSG